MPDHTGVAGNDVIYNSSADLGPNCSLAGVSYHLSVMTLLESQPRTPAYSSTVQQLGSSREQGVERHRKSVNIL